MKQREIVFEYSDKHLKIDIEKENNLFSFSVHLNGFGIFWGMGGPPFEKDLKKVQEIILNQLEYNLVKCERNNSNAKRYFYSLNLFKKENVQLKLF